MGKKKIWAYNNKYYEKRSQSEAYKNAKIDRNYNSEVPHGTIEEELAKYNIHDFSHSSNKDLEDFFNKINGDENVDNSYWFMLESRLSSPERTELRHTIKDDKLPIFIKINKVEDILSNANYYKVNTDRTPSDEYMYYLKIRELAKTGQLADMKMATFKNNYIKALESRGVSKDIIESLKALSLKKWAELYYESNPDKNISNSGLPKIKNLYLISANNNDTLEKNLKKAIHKHTIQEDNSQTEEQLFDYQTGELYEHQPKVHNKAHREHRVKYNKRYGRIFRNSTIVTADLKEISIENSILKMIDYDKSKIKVSKKGNYYIPFVGSSARHNAIGRAIKNVVDMLE